MDRPPLEVADLIRAAGEAFIARNRHWMRWKHLKVLRAIARCRTAALGGHLDEGTPSDGPSFTTFRNAALFSLCSFFRYAFPIRQYMHQQPLQAPFSPNRSVSADHRSGVRGRISRFTFALLQAKDTGSPSPMTQHLSQGYLLDVQSLPGLSENRIKSSSRISNARLAFNQLASRRTIGRPRLGK
jgi:hypothetical protein